MMSFSETAKLFGKNQSYESVSSLISSRIKLLIHPGEIQE